MEDFLKKIADTYSVSLHETLNGPFIDLPRRGNLVCQLLIGFDVLEWYATVYDQMVRQDKEVWMDWMDYVGYHDGKTKDALGDDMQRDLTTFIEAWLRATDARVTRTKTKFYFGLIHFTSKNLELLLAGQWEAAPMYDPTR